MVWQNVRQAAKAAWTPASSVGHVPSASTLPRYLVCSLPRPSGQCDVFILGSFGICGQQVRRAVSWAAHRTAGIDRWGCSLCVHGQADARAQAAGTRAFSAWRTSDDCISTAGAPRALSQSHSRQGARGVSPATPTGGAPGGAEFRVPESVV